MNINKKIKLIFALCSSVTLSTTAFGITFGQLDRYYDKLGFAYSSHEASWFDADQFSVAWTSTGGSEKWVSAASFSYTYVDAGATGEGDMLSTAYNLGYRIKLSDSAELVPLIGFSYQTLFSDGWALADIWSVSYGVSAVYALAENTVLSAAAIGITGDWDDWYNISPNDSADSLHYGISIEQFFNDSASISLSYGTNSLGSSFVSLGYNILL